MFIFICDFLRFFSCDNIYTFTSFRPLKLEKKKRKKKKVKHPSALLKLITTHKYAKTMICPNNTLF